ncbi:hypothetical protein HCN44_002336 [Aphidius gifuensis]|uniref:Uncharacterized protein n=1 Tax=Aphidius gifuensis TaxID=684658 RepID=A0A834XZT6_APHGI|nr:uncharacterized protein C7orf26 homolog [Aphidius gifuensis]KAF7996690.1 hypothetical protein HCN44_002336 [Aphidius gifuensis]
MSYPPVIQPTNHSMTDADIKYYLKKLEFPNCAKEALVAIANLPRMSASTARQQIQIQTELMTEFVFGEIDKLKQLKSSRALQELQLIEVLSEFFRCPEHSPAVKNAVFLLLFPAEYPRYEILGNLSSLSIATQNTEVLDSTGMWMQQLGSTSPQSVALAKHILDEFFIYTLNAIDKLNMLPSIVPHFTANLLTAIGEVYKDVDPPNKLLKLAGDWIDDNPDLLTTSLIDNPALPSGGIPMTPITPIAGLFRWCILNPVRPKVENTDKDNNDNNSLKFYSKIQQLLMDAVLRLKTSNGNKHAISAQHLAQTTRDLTGLLDQSRNNEKECNLALERLAQAVSTALSVNCIYGYQQELFALLQPLASRHFLIDWIIMTYGTKSTIV